MTNNNTNDTKILDLNQTMNDFIVGLMKQTMERLMQEELSNVLQYEKYSYDGHGTGNSRIGAYARDYETRYGTIHDLKIPTVLQLHFKLIQLDCFIYKAFEHFFILFLRHICIVYFCLMCYNQYYLKGW